jgi:hypothetical protein
MSATPAAPVSGPQGIFIEDTGLGSYADLAVVRSDVDISRTGLTIAILHRDAVTFVAPRSAKLTKVAEFGGKRIGILRPNPENLGFLDQVLVEYGVDPRSVTQIARGRRLRGAHLPSRSPGGC